jgi:hypothetical protein
MAVFYNKERSKLGSVTGSIISFSTKLETNEPTDPNNKRLLPAGYLRCDGSVYSANIYPLLAEIVGTGDNCKFKKSSTTLRSDQFQVPDLLVKHIRASTGANVGTINDLQYQTATGTTLTKSGIGLDVLSNINSTYTLSYTGSFYLPSVTVDLRGQPSFTRTTGDYTENSDVPYNGIIPHAHFSTTLRSRTKNYGGTNTATTQNNYDRRSSTLDICTWYKNTYQILCQHSAETSGGYPTSTFSRSFPGNTSNAWKFTNMCLTSCRFNTTDGGASCLIPTTAAACDSCVYSFQYPAQYTGGNFSSGAYQTTLCGGPITYTSTGYLMCFPSGFFGGIVSSCGYAAPSAGNYGAGNPGLITLSGNFSGVTVPFATGSSTLTGYMGLSNVTTQTSDFGNDGTHKHRTPLTPQPHTYQVRTKAQTFPAEGLTSTITVNTTAEKKADNYIQPYVVVEYLIKV